MAKTQEIRSTRKAIFLGSLAGWIMRAYSKLLRVKIIDNCGITKTETFPHPVIFALWHNRIFAIPPVWQRTLYWRNAVALTSASKDGATLEAAFKALGISAVRGSSSRRGAAALIALRRAIKEGKDTGITPDGPRGPLYSMQPGIIKLSETTGAPIIPLHLTVSSAWHLKTWDRLCIPKPFSKITVTFDSAFPVTKGIDETAFEKKSDELRDILLKHVEPDTLPS